MLDSASDAPNGLDSESPLVRVGGCKRPIQAANSLCTAFLCMELNLDGRTQTAIVRAKLVAAGVPCEWPLQDCYNDLVLYAWYPFHSESSHCAPLDSCHRLVATYGVRYMWPTALPSVLINFTSQVLTGPHAHARHDARHHIAQTEYRRMHMLKAHMEAPALSVGISLMLADHGKPLRPLRHQLILVQSGPTPDAAWAANTSYSSLPTVVRLLLLLS